MLPRTFIYLTILWHSRCEWVEIPQRQYHEQARPHSYKDDASDTSTTTTTHNPVTPDEKANRINVNRLNNPSVAPAAEGATTKQVRLEGNIKLNKKDVPRAHVNSKLGVEASTRSDPMYRNVSLNQLWVKGNVVRVPAPHTSRKDATEISFKDSNQGKATSIPLLKNQIESNRPIRRIYIHDLKKQKQSIEDASAFNSNLDKTTESTDDVTVSFKNIGKDKYRSQILDVDLESETETYTSGKVITPSQMELQNEAQILQMNKPSNEVSEKQLAKLSDAEQRISVKRIDISSLALPKNPEFVTKQEFVDDEDAKLLYEDFEENKHIDNSDPVIESSPELLPTMATEHDVSKGESFATTTSSEANSYNNDSQDSIVENKSNPLESLVKLLKAVSDRISRRAHTTINSKTRYLERLRDNIIYTIEERIESMWPDDRRRVGRGAGAEGAARGHVQFPSSEGALMTISFLTFAVFLIKLVLQVIHTYKSKSMMVSPAVFAVSRAAADRVYGPTHN